LRARRKFGNELLCIIELVVVVVVVVFVVVAVVSVVFEYEVQKAAPANTEFSQRAAL